MAADPSTEFQDWELLANSDSPHPDDHLEETEADSDGVLRLDNFSLDNDDRFGIPNSEEASVESGNSRWVDLGPDYETRYQTKDATELWSESGSDRSAEHELRDFDNEKTEIDFSGTGETSGKEGEFDSCDCTSCNVEGKIEIGFDEAVKSFEEFAGNQVADKDLSNFWSDPGGGILVFSDAEKMTEDAVVLAASESGGTVEEANSSAVTVGKRGGGCDEGKRKVVWWKVPFELLKYCAFRISPVWTFSMAAAVLGFVILGRRLYKMKRKARSLQLKVTVDDKKVSQSASGAARLNKSFSAVRGVPLVRPLLPAASGVYSLPVFNLR